MSTLRETTSEGPSSGVFARADVIGYMPRNGPKLVCKLKGVVGWIAAYLRSGSALNLMTRTRRRLRVHETISLGDKRFVSILEVDGQSFLIGGGAGSVALLATLAPASQDCSSFEGVLGRALQTREVR